MQITGSRRCQRGAGLWGTLFVLAVIAFVAVVGLKVVPIYLNQMKVAAAVKEVAADPRFNANTDPSTLRSALQRHWDIESIDTIQPKDIAVTRDDRGVSLSYDYEARTHLFYNIYVVIHFEGERPLARGS